MTTEFAEQLDAMIHGGGYALSSPRIRYLQLRAALVAIQRCGMEKPMSAVCELFRLGDLLERE